MAARMNLIRFVGGSLLLHLMIMLASYQGEAMEMNSKEWSSITVGSRAEKHYPKENIKLRGSGNELNDDSITKDPVADSIPKEKNVLRLHSMDFHQNSDEIIHGESQDRQQLEAHARGEMEHAHMHHMDPKVMVFFLLDDLKLGKTMPIYFPDLSSSHFLPKEEADAIPFLLKELPDLLQRFSFSRGSPQAKAMEDTLRQCEIAPIKGETKFCATSIESMLNFAQQILGSETNINSLSTIHLTKLTSSFQNYTIMEVPRQISAPKMVACHTMPYPYTVFYCHYQETESRVYRVSLAGEHGDKVEAIGVCHMDTSQWNHNHISLRVLGIKAGTSPVCHFFPADHLVFIPSTSI